MILSRYKRHFPFDAVTAGSVVTIGSFDGVHLGHRALLTKVINEAKSRDLPSIVMSFEPTPKEFFARGKPPARLMRFREKFDALKAAGIDIFFCPRFDDEMKNISADAFVRQILIHALNVQYLVIGDDFRFAHNREGSLKTLLRAANALDFEVEQVGSVVLAEQRVSSTLLRDALWSGDLDAARQMLGRNYRMTGKVITGQRLGRTLGYPTANVNLNRRQSPLMGIFAVKIHGLGDRVRDGVASIGTRPTFGGTVPLLEVHVFDFDEDIYGRVIHVDFIKRLRSEQKFDDIEALVSQMDKDAENARAALAESAVD